MSHPNKVESRDLLRDLKDSSKIYKFRWISLTTTNVDFWNCLGYRYHTKQIISTYLLYASIKTGFPIFRANFVTSGIRPELYTVFVLSVLRPVQLFTCHTFVSSLLLGRWSSETLGSDLHTKVTFSFLIGNMSKRIHTPRISTNIVVSVLVKVLIPILDGIIHQSYNSRVI